MCHFFFVPLQPQRFKKGECYGNSNYSTKTHLLVYSTKRLQIDKFFIPQNGLDDSAKTQKWFGVGYGGYSGRSYL